MALFSPAGHTEPSDADRIRTRAPRAVWRHRIADKPDAWLILIIPSTDSEAAVEEMLIAHFGEGLIVYTCQDE